MSVCFFYVLFLPDSQLWDYDSNEMDMLGVILWKIKKIFTVSL